LVVNRAAKHLRRAAIVLVGVTVLLVGVLTVFEWQYLTVGAQFVTNPNLQSIVVNGASQEDGQFPGLPRAMSLDDVDVILAIASSHTQSATAVIPVYELTSGYLDAGTGSGSYRVLGLGGDASWVTNATNVAGRYGLAADFEGDAEVYVDACHFEADTEDPQGPGGIICDSSAGVSLSIGLLDKSSLIHVFIESKLPSQTPNLYVDEETFGQLASIHYGHPWSEIKAEIGYGGSPFDSYWMMMHVFVRVENSLDVPAVGEALEQAGYSVSYTYQLFADVVESVRMGMWLLIGIVSLALLAGCLVTASQLKSYLRLAHRDIGILRHFGYSPKQVETMYAFPLRRLCLTTAIVAVVGAAAGLPLLLGAPWFVAINVAIPWLMLAVVYVLVRFLDLPKHTRLPVLTLLKLDREFE
jgi:hypothetical protein